jgi:hypothetical protein
VEALMSVGDANICGRWRIVETEGWNQDALDLVGPAEISFGADGGGELKMIAIGADVDYLVSERNGRARVEFSWSGFDDGDPSCGRGFAERAGDRLVGMLFIHRGDASSFLAEPWRSEDDRRPTSRSSGRPKRRR